MTFPVSKTTGNEMDQRRTHYFPANDERVVTGLCPNGQFGAYLEREDGRVRGYGHTRLAAIADLVEALELDGAAA
ncbi:hypothetical protein KUL72_20895 [Bradyrhizobium arachidis]|uniref:hypothetical protein n=1 Tax=Bradyrhizobium arachidis TaxID=858423 RepID=UPI002161F3BE|nr:hypothetical protein [Bradyrhizobium arachidis]UVO33972.1 hypothetical protein KUL72_20895 [Bradyrhizobium arachidis]